MNISKKNLILTKILYSNLKLQKRQNKMIFFNKNLEKN